MPVRSKALKVQCTAALFHVYDHFIHLVHNSQIEPESQSQLLDATVNMEGVLLAGIPGAGGFDAVFAVTLGASCENVTQAWSSLNVLAMLVREDPHGVSLENNDPRAKEITTAVFSIQLE